MSDVFEGTVKDLTFKGAGVVDHPSGRIFFVDGVWPGDEGQFQIIKSDKRYGHARLLKLLKSSADRVKPVCPHHGVEESSCGGCPWMFADYKSQLSAKMSIIRNQLERAKISAEVKQILPSMPLGYRNRAQIKTEGTHIGFVSKGTKTLAPIEDCIVLEDSARKVLKGLRDKLPNPAWKPKGEFKWNFFEIESGMNLDEATLNQRRSFGQGNTLQNEVMVAWVAKKVADLNPVDSCLELFAGSGNFTKAIRSAGNFPIVASEMDEQALVKLNDLMLDNVQTIAANLYNPSSWNLLKKKSKGADLLFLDPPREGFEEIGSFIEEISSFKSVVYVSCDLVSLVRDIKNLEKFGFIVEEFQPIDQFPNTHHIEFLVSLKKK